MIEKLNEESLFSKSRGNPDGLALFNLMEKINELVEEVNEQELKD